MSGDDRDDPANHQGHDDNEGEDLASPRERDLRIVLLVLPAMPVGRFTLGKAQNPIREARMDRLILSEFFGRGIWRRSEADRFDHAAGDEIRSSRFGRVSLTLGSEARDGFDALRARIEPRRDPETGDLARIPEWAGKHDGRVARIAGVLHLAEHDPSEPVSAATIDAAECIGACFIAHALLVLDGDSTLTP
jgi:hypothetical protein